MSRWIETRIGEMSSPLAPRPTGETALVPKLAGIRAVLLDVYGTLLVSACGDISLASEGARGDVATAALAAVGVETSLGGDDIVQKLHVQIEAAHARSASAFPEVDIRECWAALLNDLGIGLSTTDLERLAVEYEGGVNPLWPMPGLEPTLEGLHQLGLGMGIISNAQFFTPAMLQALSGRELEAWGFDPQLCFWSYELREAKPGTYLYEKAAEATARLGRPEQVLFVGNDLRNDIMPAARVGFRTALFAGDARSLRWREGDPSVAGVVPDAVVTDLRQLLDIVA